MKINVYDPSGLNTKQIEEIVEVGLEAFGEGMTREEILEHALQADKLYLLEDDKVRGFSGLEFRDEGPYLSGSALAVCARGAGKYTELTTRRIQDAISAGHKLISTRTQNPKVEMGFRKSLQALVVRGVIDEFEITRVHQKDIYGRMLTAERPRSRDIEINAHYDALDYERGDAFFLEAKVTYFTPCGDW
jgi:hypothetical protein